MSDQNWPVRVKTNGDDFASLECGRVLVEFTKDSDTYEGCVREDKVVAEMRELGVEVDE